MNKVEVFILDRKLASYKEATFKNAHKILKLTRQKNRYLEIYLVTNSRMSKNVLAFRAAKNFPRPDLRQKPLGEIHLNPDYIKKHRQNPIFMLIHGYLHLLGYDHKKRNDRIKMQKKEAKLLSKI